MHSAALSNEKSCLTSVVRSAPAKVNLYLGIHEGTDEEGYHQADSLMVALSLHDEVTVELASDIEVECLPPAEYPAEKNTAWQAASMLARELGPMPDGSGRGAHITIEKCVPEKGGLGGSSTDAAATLLALCDLWNIDEHDERVLRIARKVGADVPFFIDGVPALLGGRGDETVEVFDDVPEMDLALVRPQGQGVSTGAAYRQFDASPMQAPGPESMCAALRDREVQAIAALLFNNLAPAAATLAPETGEVTEWLKAQPGVLGALLSGSGSCSFAICRDEDAAWKVANAAKNRGWWATTAKTLNSV